MRMAHVFWVAMLLPAEAALAELPADVPATWPPPPDFKTPVDYLQWWIEQQGDRRGDAAPLWEALREPRDHDKDEKKAAHRALWGRNEEGCLPGMLTDYDPATHRRYARDRERYRWDPDDDLDWEEAFQSQERHGLRARILEAARRPRFILVPSGFHEVDQENEEQGLTADDGLLLMVLLPSLSVQRQASSVLLQNAWRAPGGEIDVDRMFEAIVASLQIAGQLDRGTPSPIEYLVAIAIRAMAHDTALRVLKEVELDVEQMQRFELLLRRHDGRDVSQVDVTPYELATMLDLLQFLYQSDQDGVPRADMDRVRRLLVHLKLMKDLYSALYVQAILDLEGEIGRYDAATAVQQILKLHLDIRDLRRRRLPQQAYAEIDERIDSFRSDPGTHVLWRQKQIAYLGDGIMAVLAAQAEARRRGTHLVWRLHREHAETGAWPPSLRELRGFQARWRNDPFSGTEFIYRVDPAGPTLYTVGMSGEDDGGVHDMHWGRRGADPDASPEEQLKHRKPKKADYVFWPIPD